MLKKFQRVDYWILVPYATLSVLGIVMVFSATQNAYLNPLASFLKQALFVLIGWAGALLTFHLNPKVARRPKVLNFLMVTTLILLVIARLAPAVNGAHGWINFGGFTLQPVELAKIVLIIYFADLLTKKPWVPRSGIFKQWRHWAAGHFFSKLWLPGLMLVMVIIMPDLGNLFITMAVLSCLLLASGVSWKWNIVTMLFFFLVLLFLPELISLLHLGSTSNYAIRRLTNFVNPWHDIDQSRQLLYAYYAISHGGLFGVGLGNSLLKPYLPESNTDFIMAVTAEELGAILVSIVLMMVFLLIGRLIYLGIKQKNQFNRLFMFGLATLLLMQTFVNLGGVLGLLPITGVVFPFISGGGSSFVFFSAAIGFALNLSAKNKKRKVLDPQDNAARRELKR
ncbi:FtsW/RodA/SpoVE family cell cycle protein [Leuconostocaceae bacterium ESL0958]|nr:FtsW/RodA/SpoVE family cell cycle protein [Leuconostocaceae bacterium ESL0958]